MFEPLLPLNFLRRAARLFPAKTAVIDGERRYTYGELEARVHRLANALLHMGVAQGDKVAVLSPNSHRVLEAFFAVPQLGAVLVPLNFRLTTPEFAYILEHAEAQVVLVDWEYAHQIAPLVDTLKGIKHYVLLRDSEEPTASLPAQDRKSTRLNSSHVRISYAVFCLKKKKKYAKIQHNQRQIQTVKK